jgi:transcription elongation factor Elf1
VSTKHIRTVADVCRFGAAVTITCGNCGAARTMDGIELGRHFGAKQLAQIRHRFKCSRCGKKEAGLTVLPPP